MLAFVNRDQCDETRPHCQRCTGAGVECPGYVQTRKFIDQGASVRRRYAPYQEVHSRAGTPVNAGQVSEEQVPDSTRNEMQAEPSHEPILASRDDLDMVEQASDMNLMQNQFSVSNAPEPAYVREINSVPGHGSSRGTLQHPVSPNVAIGLSPNLEHANRSSLHERPDYGRLLSSESVSQRNEKEEFQDIFSELMTGTEHEVAFLIRHFCQVIAPWYVFFSVAFFHRLTINLGLMSLTWANSSPSWRPSVPLAAMPSSIQLQLYQQNNSAGSKVPSHPPEVACSPVLQQLKFI